MAWILDWSQLTDSWNFNWFSRHWIQSSGSSDFGYGRFLSGFGFPGYCPGGSSVRCWILGFSGYWRPMNQSI